MGQKVNPNIFRVGPSLGKKWESIFYAKKKYADFLIQDIKIRNFIKTKCSNAQVSKVVFERASDKVNITIHAAKPGVLIGKSGANLDALKNSIAKISDHEIKIDIKEISRPDSDANLVAQSIVSQIEKRVSFRRAMKMAMQSCMNQSKVKGVKVACSGRLGGAEIARSEWAKEGRVPLHTIRADIDYALAEANTTYGVIGVKVWIYKGDYA